MRHENGKHESSDQRAHSANVPIDTPLAFGSSQASYLVPLYKYLRARRRHDRCAYQRITTPAREQLALQSPRIAVATGGRDAAGPSSPPFIPPHQMAGHIPQRQVEVPGVTLDDSGNHVK